jgi:hypothetical protein
VAWSLDELRPLEFASGESVRDPRDWPRRRRQLQNLFEEVMYGPWPSPIDLPGLEVSTLCSDAEALDGTATLTELAVSIADPDCRFRLLLLTPHARGPHRCFLGVNFHGNHTVIDHAGVALHDRWTVGGRGLDRGHAKDRWDVRGTVSAGQAVATFFCGDLVQDRPDLAAVDLHGFVRDGRRPGALMVWAWGLAVARTVLSARADIAADAIVAVGHSRLGKAALLAGGWDAGFGAVIAAQSGTGGAAPSRKSPELCHVNSGRPEAETIEAITSSFPHWFSSALASYADRVEELPVDQHQLLALCAPVPTLVWAGAADLWADPQGTFRTVEAASPVFGFLGAHQPPFTAPAVGEISDGALAYGLRSGGHTVTTDDWAAWRHWCDVQLA